MEGIAPLPESGTLADACREALEAERSGTPAELLQAGAAIGASGSAPGAAAVVDLTAAAIETARRLASEPPSEGEGSVSAQPPAAAAAALWMQGRAAELAAGIGEPAAALHAEAQTQIARAQMHAFEDLYDAAREPARVVLIARMRTGSLFRLGLGLGRDEPASGAERAGLSAFAEALGAAEEIAAQVGRAGTAELLHADLRAGVYELPVSYALAADPGLAAEMSAALDSERVGGLATKLVGGDAIAQAREASLALVAEATDALNGAGTNDAKSLEAIAGKVAERGGRTPME